jgi:nucleoside-diphosphate-sugar epimerase
MSRVLVTGASGFIGRALVSKLVREDFDIEVAVRKHSTRIFNQKVNVHTIEELSPNIDWSLPLFEVDVVVHLAARVHVMSETQTDVLSEYRHFNVHSTLNLARQAASIGIRRFVYISSIKVNGEFTSGDCVFSASDIPAPVDPYAISKYEAEVGLRKLGEETGMEITIIRPPLVYGPGVKANFLNLMRLVYRKIPLPFGSITNSRSFVALDNLVDLIMVCIDSPNAADNIFLVSDGLDLSIIDLSSYIGDALGRRACLIPIPVFCLIFIFKLLGRSNARMRICSSLKVDIKKTKELLGWNPVISVEDGLIQCAEYFLSHTEE